MPHQRARAATLSLIDAQGHLNAAAPADRARRLVELIAVAKQRRDDMVTLADSNPAEFLRVALPADARAKLPVEATPFVEDAADETGDLEVLHVDHVDPANDFYLHFLNTPKGKFALHFAGKPPTLASGARVRVRGMKLDNAIVLAAGGTLDPPVQALGGSASPRTLGAQSTLAILVNFSDAPTQPFTAATAQAVMFGTTSNYDYEALLPTDDAHRRRRRLVHHRGDGWRVQLQQHRIAGEVGGGRRRLRAHELFAFRLHLSRQHLRLVGTGYCRRQPFERVDSHPLRLQPIGSRS